MIGSIAYTCILYIMIYLPVDTYDHLAAKACINWLVQYYYLLPRHNNYIFWPQQIVWQLLNFNLEINLAQDIAEKHKGYLLANY